MMHDDARMWEDGIGCCYYVRTFPGKYPGVTEWIEISVAPFRRSGRFEWDGIISMSLPNDEREQWNTRHTFASRDDAAAYAAAGIEVCERIVSEMTRGLVPFLPHRAMAEACDRHLAEHADVVSLKARIDTSDDHRTRMDLRNELSRTRKDLAFAWYGANDWRNFMPAPADVAAE